MEDVQTIVDLSMIHHAAEQVQICMDQRQCRMKEDAAANIHHLLEIQLQGHLLGNSKVQLSIQIEWH
jgi:hypothetical protein